MKSSSVTKQEADLIVAYLRSSEKTIFYQWIVKEQTPGEFFIAHTNESPYIKRNEDPKVKEQKSVEAKFVNKLFEPYKGKYIRNSDTGTLTINSPELIAQFKKEALEWQQKNANEPKNKSDMKNDSPPSYEEAVRFDFKDSKDAYPASGNTRQNSSQSIDQFDLLRAQETLKNLMDEKKGEKITGFDVVGEKLSIKTEEDPNKKQATREAVQKFLPAGSTENVSGQYYFFITIKTLIDNQKKLQEALQKQKESLYQAQQPSRYIKR